MAPPTIDPDDEFDQIVSGLDIPDQKLPEDYSTFTDLELTRKFNVARRQPGILHPRNDAEHDRQAYYHGLLLEMRKRGL